MSDAVATEDSQEETRGHQAGGPITKMVVGAIGVVFGDIGTSPIYAFRETFAVPRDWIVKSPTRMPTAIGMIQALKPGWT